MSVDITIQETVNDVEITVNQTVITVNVTRTTGGGGGGSQTPSSLYNQYNGTSVTVPSGFTLTRIVSLNDINTAFTGIVTGTDLVITDGVSGDIYLIDGYTI